MRILMTTDAVGGVWSYSIELSRALARYGCEVHLACMGGEAGEARRAEAAAVANVTLHEASYRLEWMDDPWEDVQRAAAWLQSLLGKTRANLLHLNCYGPAARAFDVPVLLVAHSCVHTWWRATRGADPGDEWFRYRQCVIGALSSASCIVAPTAASLTATADCYEEVNLLGRACVIRNGINASRWTAARPPASHRVLGVGRVWDEAKNLQQLVAVAPLLPCPVIIAGDGEPPGGAPGVTLLGPLPRRQLAACYRRATVFAHPARYEPFGLAILEAALSGCPLVLGDIGSLRELWDGVALFVEPDDTEGWAATIRRLLADSGERRERGRAARHRALRYSASRMAAGYFGRYRQLLALEAEDVA